MRRAAYNGEQDKVLLGIIDVNEKLVAGEGLGVFYPSRLSNQGLVCFLSFSEGLWVHFTMEKLSGRCFVGEFWV